MMVTIMLHWPQAAILSMQEVLPPSKVLDPQKIVSCSNSTSLVHSNGPKNCTQQRVAMRMALVQASQNMTMKSVSSILEQEVLPRTVGAAQITISPFGHWINRQDLWIGDAELIWHISRILNWNLKTDTKHQNFLSLRWKPNLHYIRDKMGTEE